MNLYNIIGSCVLSLSEYVTIELIYVVSKHTTASV
jgi:hypothetical protein